MKKAIVSIAVVAVLAAVAWFLAIRFHLYIPTYEESQAIQEAELRGEAVIEFNGFKKGPEGKLLVGLKISEKYLTEPKHYSVVIIERQWEEGDEFGEVYDTSAHFGTKSYKDGYYYCEISDKMAHEPRKLRFSLTMDYKRRKFTPLIVDYKPSMAK